MNLPVNVNGSMLFICKIYAKIVPKITTIAFRPNDMYFLHSFCQTDSSLISCKFILYFKF